MYAWYSQEVHLYFHSSHTHDQVLSSDVAPLKQAKKYIDPHIERGMTKPLQLMQYIPNELQSQITTTQITNYIQRVKKGKNNENNTPFSMNVFDLKNWIKHNCSLPDSEDHCFVVDSFIDPYSLNDTIPVFRIFVSTKRLLRYAILSEMWQIDATYKLNWQCYPLFPIGVTDMSKNFHPVGWALTSYETTEDFEFVLRALKHGVYQTVAITYLPKFIMGDAAESICNEVKKLNPIIKRSMCWYHMINRVDVHLSKVRDTFLRYSLRKDIEFIQGAGCEKEFYFVINLFEKKYLGVEGGGCENFLKIFSSTMEG
jgi:hypothetical protein